MLVLGSVNDPFLKRGTHLPSPGSRFHVCFRDFSGGVLLKHKMVQTRSLKLQTQMVNWQLKSLFSNRYMYDCVMGHSGDEWAIQCTIFDMLMPNLVEAIKLTASLHEWQWRRAILQWWPYSFWRLKGCLGFFVQNDLDQSLQVYMQILRVEMMHLSAKQDAINSTHINIFWSWQRKDYSRTACQPGTS